ncbi:MAG: hypothetical protein LBT79_00260 [Elusimicrobiota bacterium]|jgi:hypothetical protein|nr:hypothetical protein [Elusimicrobiota bacterium]
MKKVKAILKVIKEMLDGTISGKMSGCCGRGYIPEHKCQDGKQKEVKNQKDAIE